MLLFRIVLTIVILYVSSMLILTTWTNQLRFNPMFLLEAVGVNILSPAHKVDIDYKNSLYSKFVMSNNSDNGNIGIAFYEFAVINSSSANLTIKEVHLEYLLDGKKEQEESYAIKTYELYSPTHKKTVDTAKFQTKEDSYNFMDWKNLRQEIAKNNVVVPGGVIRGSVYYVLRIKESNDLSRITNMKIVVRDFLGNESFHPVQPSDTAAREASTIIFDNSA